MQDSKINKILILAIVHLATFGILSLTIVDLAYLMLGMLVLGAGFIISLCIIVND